MVHGVDGNGLAICSAALGSNSQRNNREMPTDCYRVHLSHFQLVLD